MKFIDSQYNAPVRVAVNKDYKKYIAHAQVVYFLVRAHNLTREELIKYFEDRQEKGQQYVMPFQQASLNTPH
jgi:hypothetical protein